MLTALGPAGLLWIVSLGCSEQPRTSAGSAEGSGQPRLVLYLPCTVNKDYLSRYNPDAGYTPHLERFARDALVFTKHQSEAGQSGIAYASIFTGDQATQHGVYAHAKEIPDSAYLISEAFSDAGYETYFWAKQGMAHAALNGKGLDRTERFGACCGPATRNLPSSSRGLARTIAPL